MDDQWTPEKAEVIRTSVQYRKHGTDRNRYHWQRAVDALNRSRPDSAVSRREQ